MKINRYTEMYKGIETRQVKMWRQVRLYSMHRYYPEPLVKSIKLAQQTMVSDGLRPEFKVPSGVNFAPPYLEDYAKLHPFWDYAAGEPHARMDSLNSEVTKYRWDTAAGAQQQLPAGAFAKEIVEAHVGRDSGSKLAELARGLNRQTGIDNDYITKKLVMKPLVLKRVSNQTGKGKIPSFYALVIVGDRNGMVGLGEGKSRDEMPKAIFKAHWDAIRNLREIPRYEDRTIYGDIDYRYHGVKLHLRSAKPGFGLRVNHVIFEICECAGIKDLSGKVYKSRNDMNVAKGTIEALVGAQKTLDDIAMARGKKLVDVRKVYYSS